MATIIVACDLNYLIGTADNKIPWYLPDDLKFFKETTLGHPIIMGRNTWNSLPKKPLPKRLNIVVSKTIPESTDEDTIDYGGPIFVSNIQDAINTATWYMSYKEPYIIGGGQIYRSALAEGHVDKIIMTKVSGAYRGIIYFPAPITLGFYKNRDIMVHNDFTIEEYIKGT